MSPHVGRIILATALLVAAATSSPAAEESEDALFSSALSPLERKTAFIQEADGLLQGLKRTPENSNFCADLVSHLIDLELSIGRIDAAEKVERLLPKDHMYPGGISPMWVDFSKEVASYRIALAWFGKGEFKKSALAACEMRCARGSIARDSYDFNGGEADGSIKWSQTPDRQAVLRTAMQRLASQGERADCTQVADQIIADYENSEHWRPRESPDPRSVDFELMEVLDPVFSLLVKQDGAKAATRKAAELLRQHPLELGEEMRWIALEQAKEGRSDEAKKWARNFFTRNCYTYLLMEMAAIEARSDQAAKSRRDFMQAEARMEMARKKFKRKLVEQLAISYAKSGEYQKSRRLLDRAGKLNFYCEPSRNSGVFQPERIEGEPSSLLISMAANAGDFAVALGMAAELPNNSTKVYVYEGIASVQMKAGDAPGANATLTKAWDIVLQWQPSEEKWNGLRSIEEAQRLLKPKADSVETLKATFRSTLSATDEKTAGFRAEIVRTVIEDGDLNSASEMMEEMPRGTVRNELEWDVAKTKAENGDFSQLKALFESGTDGDGEGFGKSDLVKAYLKSGAFNEAEKVFKAWQTEEIWKSHLGREYAVGEFVEAFASRNSVDASAKKIEGLWAGEAGALFEAWKSLAYVLLRTGDFAGASAYCQKAADLTGELKRNTKDVPEDEIQSLRQQIASAARPLQLPKSHDDWLWAGSQSVEDERPEKLRSLYIGAPTPEDKAALLVGAAQALDFKRRSQK